MSGKRLLDAVAVLKAARSIAFQHVFLQNSRLDAYSKTSSLSHVLKAQTDRVTLTAQAAVELSKKSRGTKNRSVSKDAVSKSTNSPNATSNSASIKKGVQDDSGKNSRINIITNDTLDRNSDTKQERAVPKISLNETTACGGVPNDAINHGEVTTLSSLDLARRLQRQSEKQIPSQTAQQPPNFSNLAESEAQELSIGQDQDVFYTPSLTSGPALSALPRTKLPKNLADLQESDIHVSDDGINQDVFYSTVSKATLRNALAVETTSGAQELSEDDYAKLFQSPKIASMLRGGPENFSAKGSGQVETVRKLNDQKKEEELDYVGSSPQNPPTPAPAEAHSEIHGPAADIAQDALGSASETTQVIGIN